MIEKIEISGCASYGSTPEIMGGLSKFNSVYGPNGAGKTTVSRIIADATRFPSCAMYWRAGTKLETLVYNHDFVDRNFNVSTDVKGIFTLGEKDVETQNKLAAAKADLNTLGKKIESLTDALQGAEGTGGKRAELAAIEQKFQDACWEMKKKHDKDLQGALAGYRASAEKFTQKLLAECANIPAKIPSQAELETKAKSVFDRSPSTVPEITALDDAAFLGWHNHTILKKRVIGKNDVDIAGMIQKLGNSDWVKQGISYFEINNKEYCPFCQQKAPDRLATSLAEYFDEAFSKDSATISALEAGYKREGRQLQQLIQTAIEASSPFLDADKLRTEKSLFDSRLQLNIQRIESKRNEPSRIVDLEPVDAILATAKNVIADANQKTQVHNRMVQNLAAERTDLTKQVWAFLAGVEIKSAFTSYQQDKSGVEKAIGSLERQIAAAEMDKKTKEAEIQQLENSATSVQPTVNEINKILRNFGFGNFSLATAPGGSQYKIVRPDGSDARTNLSEGERSFITFLYFYHLLRGSESSSGITADRVVVFDDPVSSLDSEILFVVSALIKQVIEEVRTGKGYVKQEFVFTHNVYFHKEITYNPKRTDRAMAEETFWTIYKASNFSIVNKHDSNPIKTSYDLLWSELRTPDISKQALQNTLRRILENYFRTLGGVNLDQLCNFFDGNEKIICKSLVSWVHDGSHSMGDDLYLAADATTMHKYLEVFHKIFDKSGHENHYKMMMGQDYAEFAASVASPSE
jgi:wobble nucleotide-excising tRNase